MPVLIYFILTGILHGFYLVVILVAAQSRNKNALGWLLAIVLGAFSMYLFTGWIARVGLNEVLVYVSGTSIPFLYLVGPAYWFYLRFITGAKTKWMKLDVIHLVPMVVCFIAASPYYFMNCSIKLQHIAMLQNNEMDIPYQRGLYFAGHIIQTLFYLYLSFATINDFRKSVQRQTREFKMLKDWIVKTYAFMVILSVIYLISFVGFIFYRDGRTFFDIAFDVAITGFIHLIGFWIIKESPVLSSAKLLTDGSPLSDIKDEELKTRILKLMESKPFLDPDYSLKEFSDQLETNTVYASRMINALFTQSFTDFVNQFRVEEVKTRLEKNPDIKLLAVALDSGFSNKHTFNRVFKKYTQQTPSEYRESMKNREQ